MKKFLREASIETLVAVVATVVIAGFILFLTIIAFMGRLG